MDCSESRGRAEASRLDRSASPSVTMRTVRTSPVSEVPPICFGSCLGRFRGSGASVPSFGVGTGLKTLSQATPGSDAAEHGRRQLLRRTDRFIRRRLDHLSDQLSVLGFEGRGVDCDLAEQKVSPSLTVTMPPPDVPSTSDPFSRF
jgi:hypothetical protein